MGEVRSESLSECMEVGRRCMDCMDTGARVPSPCSLKETSDTASQGQTQERGISLLQSSQSLKETSDTASQGHQAPEGGHSSLPWETSPFITLPYLCTGLTHQGYSSLTEVALLNLPPPASIPPPKTTPTQGFAAM